VNVVITEVTACRELSDVWVSHYEKGLRRALNSELRALFVSDPAPLQELGLVAQADEQSSRVNGRPASRPTCD
jgi:hypothetical protein